MGGKKRLNLKQMERLQSRQQQQKASKKSGAGAETKTKEIGIFPPDPKDKKVIAELRKMKVITPHSLASRLNLRISVAKHFIKELEQQGTVEYVSGSGHIRIYKMRPIAD